MARRDEKPSHQKMRHSYQSQNPKSRERGCLVLLRLLCWLSVVESLPQVIVPQRVEAAKLADKDVIIIKRLATPTRLRCQTKRPSISQRYGIAKSTLMENEAVSLKGNQREPRRGSTLLTGFDTLPLSIWECTDDVVRCRRFLNSFFSPEASLSRGLNALTGQWVSFLVQDVLYQRGTYFLRGSLVL